MARRISSFIDYILQPLAKSQNSYLKDTKDFINFIEKTKIPQNSFIVSLDVTSLYTNIPQEEGIETVCKSYETFYKKETPIPTHALKDWKCSGLYSRRTPSNLMEAIMYQSNRSFNIPPGQPPGHLNFWKISVQIPPSPGQIAVQMPPPRGNKPFYFI